MSAQPAEIRKTQQLLTALAKQTTQAGIRSYSFKAMDSMGELHRKFRDTQPKSSSDKIFNATLKLNDLFEYVQEELVINKPRVKREIEYIKEQFSSAVKDYKENQRKQFPKIRKSYTPRSR